MSAKLLTDARVGELNGEQQDLVRSITDDASRLLRITGELLNMSQVETGIYIAATARQARHYCRTSHPGRPVPGQQKQIRIQADTAADLPAIQADQEKTSWVLINFLTNAIKYSPEGSAIEVSTFRKDRHIEFIVSDHGKGIDEKYLPRIFDRYLRCQAPMTGMAPVSAFPFPRNLSMHKEDNMG